MSDYSLKKLEPIKVWARSGYQLVIIGMAKTLTPDLNRKLVALSALLATLLLPYTFTQVAVIAVAAIIGLLSYVNMVGETIPPDFLEEEITEQFFSENYSRLIINTNQEAEGEIPFQLVKEVREIAASYYGDEALTECIGFYYRHIDRIDYSEYCF